MKIFIIAEKSEVANAISSAIRNQNYDPHNTYRIAGASGHLLELKAPEAYDPKYAKWTLSDLPIAFKSWELVPKKDNDKIKKRLQDIQEGLRWCDEVIHAGDPDDEGQLIVDELLDYFHNTKPVRRLDVNDNTESYIIKMLGQTKDNAPLRPIGQSAYARTVADAMFGFNFTRYYSLSYNSSSPLSIGRVQTPTLGLVVNRDRQIESHTPIKYYDLSFTATTPTGESFPMSVNLAKSNPMLTDGRVLDPSLYNGIISAFNGKTIDAFVSRKTISDAPPLPFNLVKLQSFCSNNFKLTPQQTHDVTQMLRDYKLITYNRSSCQYLHESQHSEAPSVMKTVFSNLGITAPVNYTIKSRCFNDKYLDGEPHHAIIPTSQKYDASKLTTPELRVYKAICLYYIIQFLPQRERLSTTISSTKTPDDTYLTAAAAITTELGYYGYLHKGNSGDVPSPINNLPDGSIKIKLSNPHIEEKQTPPPKRYTQASLIEDMTCIAKYVSDPAVKKLLIEKDAGKQKENGSIGTPATRDKIVASLIERGYIAEVGNEKSSHIESTELGRSFYDALPEEIKSVNVTSEWWVITQNIQKGLCGTDELYNKLLDQINTFLSSPPPLKPILGVVSNNGSRSANVVGVCPRCGRAVIEGKKGFGCSGWNDKSNPCNFTLWKSNPLLSKNNKVVTTTMAKKLLSTGKCKVELKSVKGTMYRAILNLDDTGKYVNLKMEFDNSPKRKTKAKKQKGATCSTAMQKK